ncbi:hypothetical protein [Botrimarina sp.]|uniref:hypothetical protein n=1 Tax=Botrimarina sp. TaxID=2795802 RepID=UPI0032EF852E
MPATALLSFFLMALSGVLLDAQRRAWGRSRQDGAPSRLAVGRQWRRQTANAAIGLVGVMFALWPLTPREPAWVITYTGVMVLLAGLILLLGLGDAWASLAWARREQRRRLAEQAELLRALATERRRSDDQATGEESSRPLSRGV